MINLNGAILQTTDLENNRAFLFGDAVFETLKIVNQKVLFLEDHYFRLMASMRILRMQIPMDFTMDFFENQILNTTKSNNCADSARVRITFFRNNGGFYLPKTNDVSFLITASPLEQKNYVISEKDYEVELFKDFYVSKNLLSTLKTTNKAVYILASISADENDFQNCLIINESKNVVEATNGNIFMSLDNKIITPPISEGCLNGVMRKQIIKIIQSKTDFELIEAPISTFELQKADELFITNVITGIQPITKYRKKFYTTNISNQLIDFVNIF